MSYASATFKRPSVEQFGLITPECLPNFHQTILTKEDAKLMDTKYWQPMDIVYEAMCQIYRGHLAFGPMEQMHPYRMDMLYPPSAEFKGESSSTQLYPKNEEE